MEKSTREIEKEEEGKRREAAAEAFISSLHSNFTTKGNTTITHHQLSKFQELHRRRLQIKAKSNKLKGPKNPAVKDKIEVSTVDGSNKIKIDSQQQEENEFALFKRQKLHWGLDTKERWERKANM